MIHLATIFEQFLPEYDQHHQRSSQEYNVCSHIEACRTPIMGGFHLHCDECGYDDWLYHACRDRHCPRCQQKASLEWEQKQLSHQVDSDYFHLVFTLPHELNAWAILHPTIIYNCFFQCVWDTLNTLGHDKKRLDGQISMTAVLHTWGQNLSQHIHLHCLVPGGALGDDNEWHPAKSNYLFPIRVMSRLFRGKMVSALRQAYQAGDLNRITNAGEVSDVLNQLMKKEWVVYAKHPMNQPETIVRYLARYTRKIAISESRIINMDDKTVSFTYKDYRDNQNKILTLTGEEFIRRYLQHILPSGFMRMRHYGWLSNASCKKKLVIIKEAIKTYQMRYHLVTKEIKHIVIEIKQDFEGITCPKCKKAMMKIIGHLLPLKKYKIEPTLIA